MATLRIQSDQENRNKIELKGRNNVGIKDSKQQSQRSVLGLLHHNQNFNRTGKGDGTVKEVEKFNKGTNQYFVPSQIEPFNIYEEKKEEPAFPIYKDLQEETAKVKKEIPVPKEVKVPTAENNVKLPPRPVLEEIKDEEIVPKEIPMSLEKSFSQLSDSAKSDSRSKREACKVTRSNLYDIDEYRADIYNYFRIAEVQHRPKAGYMKKQPDITHSMRTILVDWLVEVSEEYRLHTETLYLAISYIDRFLSYMSVVRAKLQLVGTAAMFIAAKYEEIYPPEVSEFVYITDDTYTKKQVLRMEHLILRVLSFDLTVPTPHAFLMEYCLSNNQPEKIQYLAMYLSELSLLEADPYLQFLPSILSASALALARHTLREETWPHELELSTGYSLKNLRECITCLHKSFVNAKTLTQQAVQEKYKNQKYGKVSETKPRDVLPFTYDDSESA